MTFFSLARFIASTFSSRCRSMNGPFFSDLPIVVCFLLLPAFHDEPGRALVPARLVSLGRLAPGRHRMTAAGALALPAAERVIHGVHDDAAVVRSLPEPPAAAGLADRDVLMIEIADLADRREAFDADESDLARRHLHRRIQAFLGDQLDGRPGR